MPLDIKLVGFAPIKFKIINSSDCWYGWPKQIERALIDIGMEPSNEGLSICYIIDVGPKHPDENIETTSNNWIGLQRILKVIKNNKFDLIFCDSKWFLEKYLHKNNNAFYLPFGCNTDIFNTNFDTIKSSDRHYKVGFVGKDSYLKRHRFLNYLNSVEEFKTVFPLKPIYFNEVAKFYNNCLIAPNQAQFGMVNFRLFEAAACGACVVQERIKGIEEFFKEDEEIILWDSLSEMKEKIIYLLKHQEFAKKIAANGMKRVHLDHSVSKRAEFIVEKLRKLIK